MNFHDELKVALLAATLMMSGSALGQDSADDEADVILAIEEQWDAEQNGDDEWIDDLLVDNFSGWENGVPAPRSKSSTRMWDRFMDDQRQMLEHELYFQNIVVHGDTAVAHYFFSAAYQDKDDKVELSSGRYTDILVRTEEGWRFIAWHGGPSD